MSSITVQPIVTTVPNINQATLKIDMDADAERLIVLDRLTLEVINHVIRPPSGFAYLIVPQKYASTDKLLVGIVDDDLAFDCKMADGVSATIEDVQGLDMSQ
ncbi:hypothetical protein [Shewanella acanthi]|uniref:hypothetical protein n=1 Tax=Shewanella acanthi TaxID=2864212 RepID=UPI001C6553C0|nr:hypothetical protein [Shewanella acanthi]QYJ79434.1 hypothetical protein K0H61_03015 [Shewanella acanthi]